MKRMILTASLTALIIAALYGAYQAIHYYTLDPAERAQKAIEQERDDIELEYVRKHYDEWMKKADEDLKKEAGKYADEQIKARHFPQAHADTLTTDDEKNGTVAVATEGTADSIEPGNAENESGEDAGHVDNIVEGVFHYPVDTLAPKDLWYVFANVWHESGAVYYSGGFASAADAYADHVEREGGGRKLALDIGTSNQSLVLRAPDHLGAPVEWVVGTGTMRDREVGNYIRLTGRGDASESEWLVGHVFGYNAHDGDIVRTGEAIGRSGGCTWMSNQGASSGCHTHLEYKKRDVFTMYAVNGATDTSKAEPPLATFSRAMSLFENSSFKNNPGGMKEPEKFECENYTLDSNRNMLFDTENDGWECMSRSLRRYRDQGVTIRELIEHWALTTEERRANYRAKVAGYMGVTEDTLLSDIF